jgi:P27 family predicted phage terminase small subunit
MAENIPTRPIRKRGAAVPPPVPVLREVKSPEAPAHLSDEARSMWDAIVGEWVLGPDALPLLRAALESWDLFQVCRAEISRDGPTVTNPDSGLMRQHPAVKTMEGALREFRQCFRQLGLEPPKEA